MLREKILLIGGGGHCKSVIDVIESQNRFEIAGIVDKKELLGQKVLGYEIIASDDELEELINTYKYAVIAVGQLQNVDTRICLFEKLKKIGFELPVIVSSLAYVSQHAKIEEGSVIMHDVLINAGALIKENCIINSKALIEHDAIINENCHISTGAIINGGVIVEKNCFVGSNVVTKQYITIKENSFIKAGTLQV
ncbi:MAG: NeuD/PglB/VioB family sugar acetyltransferase [Campylobacteraceae bacterium]|nr:NeuD/PglB/VioB family sugar acetyltransferase [Campylobacteraceae bacterium]